MTPVIETSFDIPMDEFSTMTLEQFYAAAISSLISKVLDAA